MNKSTPKEKNILLKCTNNFFRDLLKLFQFQRDPRDICIQFFEIPFPKHTLELQTIKVNDNLVLVNGFKQVVIAETGHDDCMSVSDSTKQSTAHAATVDHQVDKEKLAVLHRNGPVGEFEVPAATDVCK
jgi:hypothetical protein